MSRKRSEDLYNKELKMEFIKEELTNKGMINAAELTFEAIAEKEREWGADICTRGEEEAKEVMTEISGFRITSSALRTSILKKYVKWCIEKGVDGVCDGVLRVKSIGTEKLKQQMVANPQHLQRYLDWVFEPEADKTVDCTYRCFYWLAYAGMQDTDILKVTAKDVDLQRMRVKYNGNDYPLYREAVSAFVDSVELDRFRYKHPKFIGDEHYRDRAEGNLLLRGFTAERNIITMRSNMAERINKARLKNKENDPHLNLSFYRVWLSGVFYRMYEGERIGIPVDFKPIAMARIEKKEHEWDESRVKRRRRENAQKYMEDYERWKEAYMV